MIEVQVQEVRDWCNSDSYDHPDAALVGRLIEERQRLLVAVRDLVTRVEGHSEQDWCSGVGDTPEPCGDVRTLTAAKSAVAFAEEKV